jgi:hypothetical protein
MFRPLKKIDTNALEFVILDNSQTVSVGSYISPNGTASSSKFAVAGNGSTPALGVVSAIVYPDKNVVRDATGKPVETITTASNNTTVAKIGVLYIPAKYDILYEADVNATLGTTTGSDGVGELAGANADVLAENSYIVVGGTGSPKLFVSYGKSGDSSTKVVGRFQKVA